jgi:ankyrin
MTALEYAMRHWDHKMLQALIASTQIKQEVAERALCLAAEQGDLEKVRLLCNLVPSVNCRGSHGLTPLHLTTVDRNNNFKCWSPTRLEIARLLLEKGANPNLLDGNKQSPLFIPVQNHWTPYVKLLLEHGADPNSPNYNGVVVLHMAMHEHKSSLELVELLLKHGASIEKAKELTGCWQEIVRGAHQSVKALLGERSRVSFC